MTANSKGKLSGLLKSRHTWDEQTSKVNSTNAKRMEKNHVENEKVKRRNLVKMKKMRI